MPETEWEIPKQLQPKPGDYGFDLDRVLTSVVGVRASVPPDALTAGTLGIERTGSGVVMRQDGMVATIGYLITEADTVWLTTADGRAVPGHAVGCDQETGFGLVQALGRLDLPALQPGASEQVAQGDTAILAAAGGRQHAIETEIVDRHEFAGYWEYLLENAIFSAPAHPLWGGAALIGRDGRLLGIGSLNLEQADAQGRRSDVNMIVPIDRLLPIFDDLTTAGRPRRPARPWLGIYAAESEDGVVIGGLADRCPAKDAGLRAGDTIVAVGDQEVNDLAGLWRGLWAAGPAGVSIPLHLVRKGSQIGVTVATADRSSFLKAPPIH